MFFLVKKFKDKENVSMMLFVIILSLFLRAHKENFISKVDFFSSYDDDTTKQQSTFCQFACSWEVLYFDECIF